MPHPFQYQGTLAETSLAEMLWTIYRHKVPGLVEITNGEITKRIHVVDGNVVHASSTDRSDRLGAFLYRTGKLSRQDLTETMSLQEDSGKRHGQLLIEQNLMTPGDLYESIKGQMESILWSLFSWQTGELTFSIGEHEEPLMIKIHLPMRQVIVRGTQKIADPKPLVAKLGRKSTVFEPAYEAEDLIEIALGAEEYALLRLIDGRRSFYEVCTEGPYGVSENARLLYAFRVLQLIRPLAAPTTKSGIKLRMPPAS
ncbi:MAG: DUF4388 domain-containing protein [Acidobacteriota bacterium]